MNEQIEAAPEITVLGIGNILLKDEGFGVRVAEYLKERYEFPENVQILDGGTLGMELLRFISGAKKLLVLDAVRGEGGAGTCYRFAGDEVEAHFQDKLSAHEIGIQDVLTLLKLTGKEIEEIVVLGAEPENLDAGLELSPRLSALVEKIAGKAIDELARWGAQAKNKG